MATETLKLWCAMCGGGGVFPVTVARDAQVSVLQEAITTKMRRHEANPASVQLFLARKKGGNKDNGTWLEENDNLDSLLRRGRVDPQYLEMQSSRLLTDEEYFGSNFQLADRQIHILVASAVPVFTPEGDVVWYGNHGGYGLPNSIKLDDPRTLRRSTLTSDVITQLDDKKVLLFHSPSMTGKTSLAVLMSNELSNRAKKRHEKVVVANFSMLAICSTQTFQDAFKHQCQVVWTDIVALPSQGYTVYFIVDNTHLVYNEPTKAAAFWQLVDYVQKDTTCGIRVLMFATYYTPVQYSSLATHVELPQDKVLDMEHLKFTSVEVEEYVAKWFVAGQSGCLEKDMMATLCGRLSCLTGRHVGLCAKAIDELNKVYQSYVDDVVELPSPVQWIRLLEGDPLDPRKCPITLFDILIHTRAVGVMKGLNQDELESLERIVCGVATAADAPTLERCICVAVLVRKHTGLAFASPVYWRFLCTKRLLDRRDQIPRALETPKTIQELITNTLRATNYDRIRETLLAGGDDVAVQRAWQLELYRAVYECTSLHHSDTSVDTGCLAREGSWN